MTASPVALITGITGQDGSYLAELLLSKGYEVHGIIRRASNFNTDRIDHIYQDPHQQPKLQLHYGDLSDGGALRGLLDDVNPTEIYNLGAQSHVRVSFDQPEYTADVVGLGVLRLLEAVRAWQKATGRVARLYQAGSSEMFGSAKPRQHEGTRFEPRSPYAVAKVYGHYQVVNHRESYGLFASNGILFNHESPRRGMTFVTRKITTHVAKWAHGDHAPLYLGNLDAKRDWGYAPEYVEAMWRMLQHDKPDDFVIATGETHSVREFVEAAFEEIGVRIRWTGVANDERGYDAKTGELIVTVDPRYYRPAEVDLLVGHPGKAMDELGWEPRVRYRELVKIMVQADIAAIEDGTQYKYR
jgi:GDPmannose 4,6-dehydratase